MTMARAAKIELRDLEIITAIGTYGVGDVMPDVHILDLTLTIAPDLVQISADDMALVFDYDALMVQIDKIARNQRYETQEYLLTLIANACANYYQIAALEICLRKQPVFAGSGSLGVRLTLEAEDLFALRDYDT